MERTIRQVRFPVPVQPRLLNVAAYARVSNGKDAMLHSLSAQVSFYSELIQNHDGWRYCGVFSDEAFTGTKESRPGFQSLMAECRAGHIDLVLTKSISRFSRNTVTTLQTVRDLRDLSVDVFFEKENIHTMSADGELMMTILASYAQEESRSASENQKWRIKRNFEDGKPWNYTMLGYRNEDGVLSIVPDEADLVRRIFREYLAGKGIAAIAKSLNAEEKITRFGNSWGKNSVSRVLTNYAYTGNLLLQTSYRQDCITKKDRPNKGEQPQFLVEGSHDAIIPKAVFDATQAEITRRAKKYAKPSRRKKVPHPFTGLLICGNCGKNYRHKKTAVRHVWICNTFNSLGKEFCASKQIPEETLTALTQEVLAVDALDSDTLRKRLSAIRVEENNTLVFCFIDGTQTTKQWKDRSRRESWTPEMKAAASEQSRIQWRKALCQE